VYSYIPLARSKPRTDEPRHSADLLVSVSPRNNIPSLSLSLSLRDETDVMKTAEKINGKKTRDRPRSGRHGLGARDRNRHRRPIQRMLYNIIIILDCARTRNNNNNDHNVIIILLHDIILYNMCPARCEGV